tara:strand:+ start:920 stop:1213 length:294 start_codon:yes stop_codon:yes gene_type:complete
MNDDYQEGYVDGFKAGVNAATLSHQNPVSFSREDFAPKTKQKRKVIIRRQSPKQKLLKQMTDKKWKVYKKGSGKKTYIQIRGEVSRSQAYKKKAKRL